jgi:hypothetical protein
MKNSAPRSGRERTVVENVPKQAGRSKTKGMSSRLVGELSGQAGQRDARRLLGLLVTYSWQSEGQLFPIRAGKNFIGRGEISSEAEHRPCDIQIPQDERLSGEHALILCRQGRYEIIDQTSSNGTFVNGQLLTTNRASELSNYTTILTGKTLWTFISIDPPSNPGEVE